MCFQSESEWLKWGKGYIPAKSTVAVHEREREGLKESLRYKSRLCEKKHDKGSRKHIRSLKGCRETRIRRHRRKTAVSFTDRLMDGGLVNVSEGERSSVNHL